MASSVKTLSHSLHMSWLDTCSAWVGLGVQWGEVHKTHQARGFPLDIGPIFMGCWWRGYLLKIRDGEEVSMTCGSTGPAGGVGMGSKGGSSTGACGSTGPSSSDWTLDSAGPSSSDSTELSGGAGMGTQGASSSDWTLDSAGPPSVGNRPSSGALECSHALVATAAEFNTATTMVAVAVTPRERQIWH